MRVRKKVVANRHSAIDHNLRQQNRVSADPYVLANDHIWPEVRILANLRRGIDHRRGMHARRIAQGLIEKLQSMRKA